VHMFPPDHGRQGQPWHERRDDQEPANRSHRIVDDYMPRCPDRAAS
jgi:hypothetical protein